MSGTVFAKPSARMPERKSVQLRSVPDRKPLSQPRAEQELGKAPEQKNLAFSFRNISVESPRREESGPIWRPRLQIQRRLKIGAVNDPLESQADAQADAVMRMPNANTPESGCAQVQVQRKCAACSGDHKCAACAEEEKQLSRKASSAATQVGGEAVPDVVHDVLRSPGRPLEAEPRAFFEARFGRSFGDVRVHDDARAAASADEVNALAYTVGNHVVFGEGQYRPAGEEGRRLIAHELAHTMQQGAGGTQLQRWESCKPARLSMVDCPPREHGEEAKAKQGDMTFVKLDAMLGAGLIVNFNIGSAAIKPSLLRMTYWKNFVRQAMEYGSRLTLIGFTDCQDEDKQNKYTRLARANAVKRIMPAKLQAQVDSVEAGVYTECVTSNDTAGDRTLNRSVAIQVADPPDWNLDEEVVPTEPLVKHEEPKTMTDCSDEEKKKLADAYSVAKAMIETALKVVGSMKKGTPEEKLLMKYFGKDAFEHRFHIRKGFSDTLREWSAKGPVYDYKCVKQHTGECETNAAGQPTLGYVKTVSLYGKPIMPRGDIHVCEAAFAQSAQELAVTVVHETSHRLDWTDDKHYCPPALGCNLSTGDAEDNADSYAQFAGEAFTRWY